MLIALGKIKRVSIFLIDDSCVAFNQCNLLFISGKDSKRVLWNRGRADG